MKFPALLACFVASSAFAQPLIYNRGVINSASFMPPTLPGGAIAQGSIFSIFGAKLGPSTGVQVNSFPLNTTLSNVSITVTQGSTTVNAIPLYVSASQINAIMPSSAPVGSASVRVINGDLKSNAMPVNIGANSFGIFTALRTGIGPGILQNFISQTNQPINSASLAAQPGQVITLWGTGLGPVSADNVAPTPGNLPTQVEVFVGGVPVSSILYSGRTPCCAGVDQIVFEVPANAPQGCWVPASVRTSGTAVSNVVTMAITPDGSSCLNSITPFQLLITAGNAASFLGIRATTHEDLGVLSPVDVVGDYVNGSAFKVPATGAFPFHPIFSFPPSGACTAYSVTGDLLHGDQLPGMIPAGATPLNFGSLFSLTGAGGMQTLQSMLGSVFYLGGSITGNAFTNTAFLSPGPYSFNISGSADIGTFSVNASMPQPLTWTNRDTLTTVNRSQPLTVTWTGSASGTQVMVLGFGVDIPTNATTVFGCLAPPGATSFTVPAIMMSNIPATRANPLQSKGVIYLVTMPGSGSDAVITASGLSSGFAGLHFATGNTVIFQ